MTNVGDDELHRPACMYRASMARSTVSNVIGSIGSGTGARRGACTSSASSSAASRAAPTCLRARLPDEGAARALRDLHDAPGFVRTCDPACACMPALRQRWAHPSQDQFAALWPGISQDREPASRVSRGCGFLTPGLAIAGASAHRPARRHAPRAAGEPSEGKPPALQSPYGPHHTGLC